MFFVPCNKSVSLRLNPLVYLGLFGLKSVEIFVVQLLVKLADCGLDV